MTTEVSETARVDHIHHWLVYLAKAGVGDLVEIHDLNEVAHQYTKQEVTDFVSLLPEMRKRLRVTVSARATYPQLPAGLSVGAAFTSGAHAEHRSSEVARGLYLTREMALYAEPFADAIAEANAHITKAIIGQNVSAEPRNVAVTKSDPYAEHDGWLRGRLCREGYGPSTHGSPEQAVSAAMLKHDAQLAVLKQRLVRPVTPPRFPSEAKACRVYRSNDR